MNESDTPQPIDIVIRLRQTRADMIGTDDEAHYWDCHDAAAEIERLRARPCPYVTGTVTHYCTLTPLTLTDEEREAVGLAAGDYLYHQDPGGRAQHIRQTLLGLLERTR
jgi:hypothetical protein